MTLDANWRKIYVDTDTRGAAKCYDNGMWNSTVCADGASCAKMCNLGGIGESDWKGTYGISSGKDGVKMMFVTKNEDMNTTNVGSRVFMMSKDPDHQGDNYNPF